MCVFFTFHRAISHMMSSLLYPLVTFVLLVVCVAYWGTTAMYPLILCLRVCVCCMFLPMCSIQLHHPESVGSS